MDHIIGKLRQKFNEIHEADEAVYPATAASAGAAASDPVSDAQRRAAEGAIAVQTAVSLVARSSMDQLARHPTVFGKNRHRLL